MGTYTELATHTDLSIRFYRRMSDSEGEGGLALDSVFTVRPTKILSTACSHIYFAIGAFPTSFSRTYRNDLHERTTNRPGRLDIHRYQTRRVASALGPSPVRRYVTMARRMMANIPRQVECLSSVRVVPGRTLRALSGWLGPRAGRRRRPTRHRRR